MKKNRLNWLGFLCFFSLQMDNLYNFPCFDLSCPHYQVVGTITCPSLHPQTLKNMEKKNPHSLWNFKAKSAGVVAPADLGCMRGDSASHACPKPPTLPKLSVLPTSFPEWSSPMCIPQQAFERAGITNQELINGEKRARQSFLFNLEPW